MCKKKKKSYLHTQDYFFFYTRKINNKDNITQGMIFYKHELVSTSIKITRSVYNKKVTCEYILKD